MLHQLRSNGRWAAMETPGAANGKQVSRRIGKEKADSRNPNERLEQSAEG